ncbi:hypothetical protein GLAREA_11727 [Glarea lozoyensis ATCC 20868]|uniref:Uncharacterized protein n=1 Tax=Glarea lozoyensis (strain ATCC 20868 / MF5171) TaxID=1116229 RepID=S3CZ70_GLAL2|nr:uncharacterized protein GLAREA_11727 [Glarea lozoyensis ATCC 20868]EPE25146.1 hypothetical protein GLAREA_11727 [Glarea lozoyensis ATCC 20868]
MARPFPTTFDDGSPMSPQSAGGSNTPISYRADVNRKKTTKWTQAKAVDYGGDDWGDEDDYGYGYEDPAPQAPVSKPTGLRQQGQVLPNQPKSEQFSVDSKKAYGQLPGIPGATNNPRERSNSFDAGEERNFSNATIRQPSPAPRAAHTSGPATRFSQITGLPSTRDPSGPPPLSISTQSTPTTGLRKASQTITPVAEVSSQDIPVRSIEPTHQVSSNPASAMTPGSDTRTPSSDFQARRDFSPSAMPQPLSARASPAPASDRERSTSGTRFPARKSSLTQAVRPDLDTVMPPSADATAPKPWANAGRSASPAGAMRTPTSPSSAGKNLPFIRPADIYKKAEEERQSMESGRPSMDSLMGNRNTIDSPVKQRAGRNSWDDEGAESGRRLQPMLDTVTERKSEYGFDGFSVNNQPGDSSSAPRSSGVDNLAVQDERRQSTSPKLPDLNRISGFGMDMFSTPSGSESQQPVNAPVSAPTRSEIPASQQTGHSLHSQPSIGLRSVVQQAFDQTDDSSVPPTPASRTESGIRRTDSESTGTTGISPIMSRAPSAAVAEGRHPDLSTPAVLEVVNEANSPVRDNKNTGTLVAQPQPVVPGFKPGHRRDISTPSPGNSPARAPDWGTSTSNAQGYEAYLSDPDRQPQSHEDAARPVAEREHSFRPHLPGGWNSYAASTRSDATQQSIEQGQSMQQFPHEPKSRTSVDDDDPELTPTTTKQRLPQSTLGGILAGPSMEGAASGAAFGTHDGNHQHAQSSAIPPRFGGYDDLPTPDPAMAPSGSLYSKVPLDPRLLPKLEQAPAETQLRPDIVHRAGSSQSSVAPTPPPKDTPQMQTSAEAPSYFSPPAESSKPNVFDRTVSDETIETTNRLQHVSTMSSDASPEEEESDRLRKEIVKHLSPQPSTSTHYENSLLGTPGDESGGQRESTYLPSEYDNYWASTDNDDGAVKPTAQRTMSDESSNINVASHPASNEVERQSVPPLNTRKSDLSEPPTAPKLQQKFSWERSTEAFTDAAAPPYRASDTQEEGEQIQPTVASSTAAGVLSSHELDQPSLSPDERDLDLDNSVQLAAQIPAPTYIGLELDERQPPTPDSQPEEKTLGRKSTFLTGGAVLGAGALGAGAAATMTRPAAGQEDSSLSLAEEKLPRSSSYPVSPSPPEEDHPSRSPDPYFPSTTSQAPLPDTTAAATVNPPLNQQLPSGLMQFKQIGLLPSSHQRIQAYNSQRELHAQFDHGLQTWMAQLQAQNPEHAGMASRFGQSAGGMQQQAPYYQQHPNANSPNTPASAGGSKPGPGPSSSTQQGLPLPGGGKLTGQQVQAKGKEFLHTAGIFGGKAGKAGKGLLAKGKSRLRGSGGGEKTSPPAKTNPQRRSSWGPLKTLSRSSGQPDSDSQQPNLSTFEGQPSQTSTIHSQRNSMSQLSNFSGNDRAASTGGASSAHNSPAPHRSAPLLSHELHSTEDVEPEMKDSHGLAIPAPVSKDQPSWDGFNATPIAEEDAFHYDKREDSAAPVSQPNEHSQNLYSDISSVSHSQQVVFGGDHPDAVDTEFNPPPNDSPGETDWVMVSPQTDSHDTPAATLPAEAQVTPTLPESKNDGESPTAAPILTSQSSAQANSKPDAPRTRASSKVSLSIPTSSQEALALIEPEVNPPLSSTVSRTETFPDSDYIPIPPKHALHHKRASLDLVKRASIDLRGPEHQYSAPRDVSEIPYDRTQMTAAGDRDVSPERDVNPTNASWLSSGPKSHSRNVSSISVLDRPRGVTTVGSENPVSSAAISPINANFAGPHSSPKQQTRNLNESQLPPDSQQQGKSTFLPPIRRTSTFGIGFGPRQKQTRFPIEDDEDTSRRTSQDWNDSSCHVDHQHGDNCIAVKNAQAVYENKRDSQTSLGQDPTLEHASIIQSSPVKPKMVRVSSSEQSPRGLVAQQSDPNFSARAVNGQPSATNRRQSQDSWRPNAASPLTEPTQISRADVPVSQPRASWEPQRARGFSGSTPQGAYGERPWANSPSKPFEQPPSSAQRYPGLFQPNLDRDGGDLPAQYYQQPIAREDAFLPRQQTNEYQISGVGPPTERPRSNSSRRNSREFFRELSGRLSRGTSRERASSRSRDGVVATPPRPFSSRGNDQSASSIASEEAREQQKRRSGFFGGANRASTAGLGAPQSRESVVAHHSGSRSDLLSSGRQSPAPDAKKRSFFGSSSTSAKPKGSKLAKAATSGNLEDGGKKKRFSGLTGLFGKSDGGSKPSTPTAGRTEASRTFSNNEKQNLSTAPSNPDIQSAYVSTPQSASTRPANGQREFSASSSKASRPVANGRRSSSRSGLFSKFGGSASPQNDGTPKSTVLDSKSKNRRPSASGLFGGFMGRKQSYPQEREKTDESRSQASTSNTPQPLPQAQTYTDLEEEHKQQEQKQQEQMRQEQGQRRQEQKGQELYDRPYRLESDPFSGQQHQQTQQRRGPSGGPEGGSQRGRQSAREPEYDNVPIPGGYNLVRGQGATASPTNYDPRGVNHLQQALNPSHMSQPTQSQAGQPQMYPAPSRGQSQHESAVPFVHNSTGNQSNPTSSPVQDYPTDRDGANFQIHAPHYISPTQTASRHKPPSFGALETYETYQARSAGRRISSEDVLARSPARLAEGQQRPYTLSLPGDDDEQPPAPIKKDSPVVASNPRFSSGLASREPGHAIAQHHQNPTINHPSSPARYGNNGRPFSPSNHATKDLPTPPVMPPNWESQSSHLDPQYTSANSPLLNQGGFGVDRSNTHRTTVSAVSQVSHLSNNDDSPILDRRAMQDKDEGVYQNSRRRSSLSITPERMVSPEIPLDHRRNLDADISRDTTPSAQIKTTELMRSASPNIYDASPRLPVTHTLTAPSPKLSPKVSPIQTSFPSPKPVAPIRMVSPEPNTLAPGSHSTRNSLTPASEEKIFAGHAPSGIVHEMDADPTPSMSATSYPGQEWNPYSGGWDDGVE